MDRGLLQRDVASIIRVTEECISNWEISRSIPQIRYMLAIIKFLGYDPPVSKKTSELGEKIAKFRRENGLRLIELAKQIGVDDRTLGRLEKGKGSFKKKTKQKVRKYLDDA